MNTIITFRSGISGMHHIPMSMYMRWPRFAQYSIRKYSDNVEKWMSEHDNLAEKEWIGQFSLSAISYLSCLLIIHVFC
jgi:hypothetical protein